MAHVTRFHFYSDSGPTTETILRRLRTAAERGMCAVSVESPGGDGVAEQAYVTIEWLAEGAS